MKNKLYILALVTAFGISQTASAQLIYVPTTTGSSNSAWSASSGCVSLSGDVSMGKRGNNVMVLQNLLISKGYLAPGLSTAYFGAITRAAVRNFQIANGISGTGYVGPLTRAKIIALTCGGGTTPPIETVSAPIITSLAPQSGPVGTVVTIYGRNFSRTNNSVNLAGVNNIAINVPSYDGVSIQFTVPTTPCSQSMQSCSPVALAPGQYPVSVSNSAGTSGNLTFTVTSANSANAAPTINGIDGPTTLSTGQQGSWTIRAVDQTGGGLSYNVVWGDENQQYGGYYYASSNTYSQSASFTHTYNRAGIYTPTFTVRGSNGFTAQVSITVNVTGSNTTGSPTITSLSPSSGPVGTTVTVTGTNFTSGNNAINFAGASRAITGIPSYDGRTLQFNVPGTPCSQGSYCAQVVIAPGTYPVSVTNDYGTSQTLYFTITSGSTSATTSQSVTLSLNQKAIINGNLEITPTQIVEDSRCPVGVTCIQAGRVVVQSLFNTGSGNSYVNLTAGGTDSYSNNGYKIEITEVTPVKVYNQTISNSEYRITYKITR